MKANADRDAEMIRLHHAERWPPGTIARELGVHASVVRRVLGQAGQVAESVAARPSMVEPYLPFIRETLAKHPKLRAGPILDGAGTRLQGPAVALSWNHRGAAAAAEGGGVSATVDAAR